MAHPKKKKPRSIILSGNGLNCERETAYANQLVGFDTEIVHISALLGGMRDIHAYDFLNLPGGFLDGDDLGAGKAQSVKWRYQRIDDSGKRFIDDLSKFVDDGKLIIGICNGFQLLVKTGLLPRIGNDLKTQLVTLTANDSGRFEDRWVHVKANPLSPCVFTKNIDRIYLPVRHGEGKMVVADNIDPAVLMNKGYGALQYCDENGAVTSDFPQNPNGSALSIAGLTDRSGRVFGLMPHPEAFVHFTQHPRWTREELPRDGDGLAIFRNAYNYITTYLS
jgi:phosphoribosylformylglycinamidine synthase subunit PurQ / glutaminase